MEIPPIRYARNGDLFIAYQVVGDGPAIVMIPGFITHIEMLWESPGHASVARRLGSFATMIFLDKRGTGLSDRPGPNITFEDMMDDVLAVLDDAGVERAVIYGTEDGGALAALFAATYPERASALVLYGTYARRLRAPDYPWGITEETVGEIREIYERRWGRDPVGLGSAAPSLYRDEVARAMWLKIQRNGVAPGAAVAWLEMTARIDVRDVLPSIRVPTIVIHRTHDRAIAVENARYLAEHIPGAKLVELPGNDHSTWVDPDPILDEVEQFVVGTKGRPVLESDRVLATVLFTDIVGSTEQAFRLGDRKWRALLDRHDERVRREIERHRGREVKNTGDGFMATFDGPARAIRCAQAVVAAVRSLGIEVRAGLHTGECEMRGEDIGGVAVHLAARVADRAGPGEVLVSSTVKDLVVGSGIDFEDRGAHPLKGIPGEWRLLAVAPSVPIGVAPHPVARE